MIVILTGMKSPNILDSKHEPIVPLERYLDNISYLVKEFQNKHVTPVILTLPPLDPARYYRFVADQIWYIHRTLGFLCRWY